MTKSASRTPARLVLADGRVFEGVSMGATTSAIGEVVFTTGMTGYQEVITDPSYAGQLVTMTAPQMGNTGINAEDTETTKPRVAGFIVHELSSVVSNWRANESLDAYLKRHNITGIACMTRARSRGTSVTPARRWRPSAPKTPRPCTTAPRRPPPWMA